jgi:hypothetical protein
LEYMSSLPLYGTFDTILPAAPGYMPGSCKQAQRQVS